MLKFILEHEPSSRQVLFYRGIRSIKTVRSKQKMIF